MAVRISPRSVVRPILICRRIPYYFPIAGRPPPMSKYSHTLPQTIMSSPLIRNSSTTPHPLLPQDVKCEEEDLPGYKPKDFYPVGLGDVFESRYKVIAKLGFGVGSSVWLCRDVKSGDYLTMKVCTRQTAGITAQATNEVAVARHIRAIDGVHPGDRYLRLVLGEFTIHGPAGEHRCLLYAPLGMTYTEFRNLLPDRVLDKALLQQTYQLILIGLDLLHQAGVVHTDISPNNILLGARDSSLFSRIERSELENPSARKVLHDRTIYRSQAMPITDGTPVLCDFGAARIGEGKFRGDVMPDFYRAPEVILGMEWDCKIDIWSIGVMVWDLFEDGRLFYALKNRILDDEQHLAEMVALMGPPPRSFLERSEKSRKYWDAEGRWIAATPIPEQSLDAREWRLEGEDHRLLLDFLCKIFRWLPEERASAQELISHPFLMQAHEQLHEAS
ncbi:CMGC/SRPK protein kinase [Emergomyces pasteurianus Ep9510]|uniref:EKC/KEOPS complex subunit BUD32 n=1 Tax=Emergomyces pasteurianus Ep9510 TaxID=1447872 RepID=A0A1J9QMG2_9EURO|nr:CMGC/SRPK protein kinase [Emergomyces pasteurianus Ep9510]